MAKSTPKHGNNAKQKTRKIREKTAATENDRLIPGFHAVRETLRLGQGALTEIWISEGKRSARIEEIIQMAEIQRIPLCFKKDSELSGIFPHMAHQGIVGVAKAFVYADFHDIMRLSFQEEDPPGLLLAADHITDEGNLGALIRTAAFFGTHGLIIPKDRSAQITPAVLKRASGAHLRLPTARVTNLSRALDDLSEKGFWIIGAAGETESSIYDFDWKRPLVLALGSEQKGLSPSTRKRCHQLVRIPSPGNVESLNVSVAGGIILSEICRQRQQ